MIQLTPREALKIQAEQIKHYEPRCPHLAALVAARTNLKAFDDLDTLYSVIDINRAIPRGGMIEAIMHTARQTMEAATPQLIHAAIEAMAYLESLKTEDLALSMAKGSLYRALTKAGVL